MLSMILFLMIFATLFFAIGHKVRTYAILRL